VQNSHCGTDGNVTSDNVTEGPKEFYGEAIGLAQAWKYKPFVCGGHPIVAQIQDRISILPPEPSFYAHSISNSGGLELRDG